METYGRIGDAQLEHILDHTAGLWNELRGERLFITGGTGFFGRWLLESFSYANRALGLGARATALSRHPQRFMDSAPHLAADPFLEFHPGDVNSFDFPQGSFTHVIHAATSADAVIYAEQPLLAYDTILCGTRRTLELARESAAKRLLFISSGAVYGRQPPELEKIPETYPGSPDPTQVGSTYGEGKRAAELLCSLYSAANPKLEVPIARCFAFSGEHLPIDKHFAIGNFVRDAIRGDTIRIGGDGTPFRSYLDASDLMIWLWTLLFRGKSQRAYNVGSGEPISIAALARKVADTLRPDLKIEIAKPADEGILPERYVPDVSRARDELGLVPRVSLEDSLRRMANLARTSG